MWSFIKNAFFLPLLLSNPFLITFWCTIVSCLFCILFFSFHFYLELIWINFIVNSYLKCEFVVLLLIFIPNVSIYLMKFERFGFGFAFLLSIWIYLNAESIKQNQKIMFSHVRFHSIWLGRRDLTVHQYNQKIITSAADVCSNYWNDRAVRCFIFSATSCV